MHGGSGLNFQQGHFADPLASMQASLGAGSMFAKTLSNMQQFDQDEAKLQMMRQDRERQAKLDAKVEAADSLAAKKEAYNLEAEKAVNSVQAKDDLANQMFQHGLTTAEQDMLVNQADSKIKASNAGFKISDSLVGIDRAKLDKDKQKRYDELAAIDGHLDTISSDGKDTYNISTKLGLLKDSYALGGLGEKEAYDKAANSLGISSDVAKGVTSSNSEQDAFVNRYTNLAQNDPLFGKSKLDKLSNWEADWAKLHPGDEKFSTSAVQGLRSSLMAANTAAIAEQKKELNDLYAKRALSAENAKDKNLDMAIRLAEMRIRAADHETSGEEKLAKALTSVTGGSKLTDEDKFSVNLAAHLKQYATSSDPKVGQNIIEAYKQAKAKGYSAAETAALVQGGIHADGVPEERQAQKYKFDNQAMFKQGPNKSYTDSTDYVALRQQQLAGNDAQKEAEFAQLQKLFAAKGGSSNLAALDKQIYDLKRTPQEAFRQAAVQAGKDFAYDEDLAGHRGIADTKIASEQTASENIGGIPVASTIKEKPTAKANTGSAMDILKHTINVQEGNATNPYKLYEDHFAKDGSIRAAFGTGSGVSDLNSSLVAIGRPDLKINYKVAGWGSALDKMRPEDRAVVHSQMDKLISHNLDISLRSSVARVNESTLDPSNKAVAQLQSAVASGYYQFGPASKVVSKAADLVTSNLSSGNYQAAMDAATKNPQLMAYPKRVADWADAIKSYASNAGYKGKLVIPEAINIDKDAALATYNGMRSQMNGLTQSDYDAMMKGYRKQAEDSKANLTFGSNTNLNTNTNIPVKTMPQLQADLANQVVLRNSALKEYDNNSYFNSPLIKFGVLKEADKYGIDISNTQNSINLIKKTDEIAVAIDKIKKAEAEKNSDTATGKAKVNRLKEITQKLQREAAEMASYNNFIGSPDQDRLANGNWK